MDLIEAKHDIFMLTTANFFSIARSLIACLRLMRYTLPSCRDFACNVSTKNYVPFGAALTAKPHEYEKCYIKRQAIEILS